MDKVDAVVLAGDSKSFIQIYGKWMVEYVIDALRSSPCIGKISIVGAAKRLKERLGEQVDYYVEERGDIFDNLEAGLKALGETGHVLIATSDIPMIREEIITDFIRKCQDLEADLCYPIVEKGINDFKYPGFNRTYVRVKEGIFTGGNIIYINPKVIKKCTSFARKVIEYRKRPWKLGRLLGLSFLLMLIMGTLSISRVEERLEQLLNIRAVAIISPFPELANDVDKSSDLEKVYQYLLDKQGSNRGGERGVEL